MLLASVNPGTVQWQAVICPRVSPVSRLRSPRLNPHAGGECQILSMKKKMTKAKKTQRRRKQFLRNEKQYEAELWWEGRQGVLGRL